MRPDPRLLLPASAVRRVPWGVRELLRCDVCGEAQTHYSGCGAPAEGDHCTSPNDCAGRAAKYLDLSAPVDGERLDAWSWALKLLHPDAVFMLAPEPDAGARWRNAWTARIASRLEVFRISDRVGARLVPETGNSIILDPWPDLSGLTPDDAARAVVVAALVAREGAHD